METKIVYDKSCTQSIPILIDFSFQYFYGHAWTMDFKCYYNWNYKYEWKRRWKKGVVNNNINLNPQTDLKLETPNEARAWLFSFTWRNNNPYSQSGLNRLI